MLTGNRKQTIIITILTALLFFTLTSGCGLKKEVVLTGKTMGTTWRVKVVADYFNTSKTLNDAIKNRLLEINKSMSLYDKESEIKRLNAHRSSDKIQGF